MDTGLISAGEPAPHFVQRAPGNPRFTFGSVAGRYIVLYLFHSAADPVAQAGLAAARERSDLFTDSFASFFGVSTDPQDETETRVANAIPGYRFFWDFDLTVSMLYGATNADGARARLWVVIDPTMRVIGAFPDDGAGQGRAAALDLLARQPPPERFAGIELQAPILYLPRVFEADFCRRLIDLYDRQGGELSGFMRQIDGRTVGVQDASHKVRRDITIEDDGLIKATQARILRSIVPEIAKVHQFQVTRMERYIVSCYDAQDGGHFAAHRDNTTSGTAHRRFAVSINLNDDFEGGKVCFPEYGPRGFKAPAGGAVVFSCSLLHKVYPVTAGRRYAFLPFVYDDAAAAVRKRNLATIAPAADPERPAEPS